MGLPIKERRYGRIQISHESIVGYDLSEVFRRFTPVAIQRDLHTVEYLGASPLFEPFEGKPEQAPLYAVVMRQDFTIRQEADGTTTRTCEAAFDHFKLISQ